MIFKHYGKFIRNRARKDGGKFLEGLKEAEGRPPMGRAEVPDRNFAPPAASNGLMNQIANDADTIGMK